MIQFFALGAIIIFFVAFLIILLGGVSFIAISKYINISGDAFVGILILIAVAVSIGFAIWVT